MTSISAVVKFPHFGWHLNFWFKYVCAPWTMCYFCNLTKSHFFISVSFITFWWQLSFLKYTVSFSGVTSKYMEPSSTSFDNWSVGSVLQRQVQFLQGGLLSFRLQCSDQWYDWQTMITTVTRTICVTCDIIVYTRTEARIYQWLDLVWLGSFTKPPLHSIWWMQLNLKTWQKDLRFQFHNSKCYSSFYSIRCLFNVKPICMSSRPYFSIFIFNIHITKKSCTCLVTILTRRCSGWSVKTQNNSILKK